MLKNPALSIINLLAFTKHALDKDRKVPVLDSKMTHYVLDEEKVRSVSDCAIEKRIVKHLNLTKCRHDNRDVTILTPKPLLDTRKATHMINVTESSNLIHCKSNC